MILEVFRYILFFVLIIALQALVINQVEFNFFFRPQVFILFILSLPVRTPHWLSLLIGFFTGMAMDLFSHTPGLSTFCCTSLAYSRYYYLRWMMPKEILERNIRPNLWTVEPQRLFPYLALFIGGYHFLVFFIQDFSLYYLGNTVLKAILSTLTAGVLITLIQFVFKRSVTE